ncbi:ABC transporter permease [Jiangella alkaliphila]|uniref:Transport permease protein n=1 Tax=Jiangella alkaliphila TaxID=419479 RepID=A0A1H2H0C5_9ACTN|nr:ABC transporter permease [Jiangella alkaliphila]SDU25276.1 ABC-2 type transport system permease protein [Jiangella alkaliphila]
MTTATAPLVRPRGTRRTVADIWTVTRRNLRHTVRLPGVLVLSATMPVIFILMFTFVFGGAIEGVLPAAAAGEYVNWLVPGLIAQFALFGGAATAAGLADDLTSGTVDRFRSLPMSRLAVLAGRTFSDLFRSAVTVTLMLGVGILIGFRWQTSPAGLIAGIGVALAFSYGMSWLMALVGLVVRSAEAVQAAVYIVVFPLGFTSAVFVPAETMPGWLEPFATHQPVTVAAGALRGLMLGEGALPPGQTVAGQVTLTLLWAAVFTVVFAPLAVRVFSRTSR